MHRQVTATGQRESSLADWVVPVALFAAASLLYSINLGRMAHPDEYYHILAAKGLLATGEPRIAEGIYTRVFLHTWLVAQSFRLFGESLATARVPSLIATAVLVAVMFVWLRHEVSTRAAWIGAVLFGISPFAVDMAQFCRFYALQCLAMFATAMLVYAAAKSPANELRRRLVLLAVALGPFLLAIYLQPTSLLGAAGLAIWAVAAIGLPWLADPHVPRGRKSLTVIGVVLAALATAAFALATGIAADLWRQYNSTPLFNSGDSSQFWYYHGWYSLFYPSLWPLTGLLGLFAITVRPMAASMALAVFALGFLLNSFAAAKSLRYIAYAQPFLFVVWAIALAGLWPYLLQFVGLIREKLGAGIRDLGGASWMADVLLVGASGFLLLANAATIRTVALLADVTVPPEEARTNWPAAREALEPWLERADIVISTEELGQLYFLGRYDVRFSPSKLAELDPEERHEFGLDHRTGRPVISTIELLDRIFECYPSGIIVGPASHWGRAVLINSEVAALITNHTRPLELPRRSGLRASIWEHPIASPPSLRCQGLPSFAHQSG